MTYILWYLAISFVISVVIVFRVLRITGNLDAGLLLWLFAIGVAMITWPYEICREVAWRVRKRLKERP